ncbi:MAG: hypothetical protein DIZ80_13470 [endosymbiont of Galathealinum brachiosum]|uniref:Surface lipoprotein assembly modifier C-terminal domain-containing protein n=1 Tax=endosymbiont of Galathealinum brachiosum TaxID=2200906 RepID=A0A370D885_9GAMM|nr:MAG: hypothetical protein DIZ80_13470 [endosymbiont of Galathealinum brachiosum]
MTRYITPLLVLLILSSQPVFANTAAFDLKHLQSLFESYKRGQSYKYAKTYQAEMEGDPYFDYLFGVSAIDTGHASEGTFALERVLLVFPDDQVARLELARGYFILQEYSLSGKTFEAVLKTNPPTKVRDTALAYLDKIRISESRYRPTHSGFVEFSLGNDDNVNAGLDEGTTFIITLDPDSFGQDDNFSSLAGGWTYAHPFTPGWLFESTLSGNFRKNAELDQFDTTTGTLQVGITHLQASSKYKAELINQQFNLDGESYRSLNGLNLNWQYTVSQQSSFNTALQYAQLDYPDLSIKNSDLITLGMNYTHAFAAYLQPILFSTLSLGTEMAEEDTNPGALSETERDIYSLRLGVVLNFTNTLALQTSIGTQNSAYAAGSALQPDTKREDDYNTANLKLIWAFARKWRLDTQFAYSDNSSTEDLKNYERNVTSMTVNYTF